MQFIIRAVQYKSFEKPRRNNGGKFLKEKPLKNTEKHEISIQLLRTLMLS